MKLCDERIYKDKRILDSTCGGRSIWYQKQHPDVLYMDGAYKEKGHDKHKPGHEVKPDLIADFRDMPLPDNHFDGAVWDPPHLIKLGETSSMARRYGVLNAETWPHDLNKGFKEHMRVLKPGSWLIFKWNCRDIPIERLLKCFPVAPLFGHRTNKQTRWLFFEKEQGEA